MADPVLVALEEQVDCYRRLAKLAELQHIHVQQNQTDALLEVLRNRQVVLGQIGRLEGIVGPAKRQWAHYVAGFAPEQRAQAEMLISEARRLLEEITAADRNDALVLQQRKLNLGRQIQQASAARQINRHYAAAAYGASRPRRMDVQR